MGEGQDVSTGIALCKGDEACEEECGRSGRESRRCYVECQRAQRRRQEEYIRMSMSDGESMRSMPSAPMDE